MSNTYLATRFTLCTISTLESRDLAVELNNVIFFFLDL